MSDFRKPLVTVNGNFPVRVICTDRKFLNKIIYLFEQNGVEHLGICDNEGYYGNDKVIKNVVVKKWQWAMEAPSKQWLGGSSHGYTYVTKHLSRDEANLLPGVIIGRVEGTEIEE